MIPLDARLLVALRATAVHLPASDLALAVRADPNAIESRMEGLRHAGFDIEFRPGFGYRLLSSPDRLIADDLWARLEVAGAPSLIREIAVFEETGSTNDIAAQRGRHGAPGGLVIFAERQIAGRGRFGRKWESASHLGLWFSLLVRPEFPLAQWPRLTTWAAAATAAALETHTGRPAGVKWPNDIWLLEKKAAGILIETSANADQTPFAIVGIGVNVNHEKDDFPEELQSSAISLRQAAGKALVRAEVAVSILVELDKRFARLGADFDRILSEARERSTVLGRWIKVRAGESVIEGVAEEIGNDGSLLLRTADGSRQTLTAGEVTLEKG
ncbi:MAG TPA: biotin--[acetyl-CoA-carboxylase] ligase [Chthoniobacteraceae bacterium]|jgi:BirA family biotin operon repressor/biotin-[acetyl-CoA-carboxylase] ligase